MDKEPLITSPAGEITARPGAGGNNIIRPTAFKPASGRGRRKPLKIQRATVLLGVLLSICGLLAWYVFTAKSVFIATEPAAAELALSGGIHVRLGDHYLARPGEFRLRATAPGYHPLEAALTVTEAQNQNVEYRLEKLPGSLTVTTTPATQAQIWLDGQAIGPAGSRLTDITAGTHTLLIKSERFREHRQEIEIEGKEVHQQLAVALEPAWAKVKIESEPAGAQVLVDDKAVGSTPITAEILEGERRLTVKLPGHKAWQDTLTVDAGENQALPLIALAKADGLVMLRSRPAGAGVTVDGQYRGQTPLELALPPGKQYAFTLYKEGYEPAHRALQIESGQDQALDIPLQAQLGKISIHSQPGDALVYIDGRLMGRADQSFSLPARQHRVTVKKKGFVDYETQVLPRPGLDQVVNARLKTEEQAKWEAVKPQIVSPAGQTLKLFKPSATFTMGTSRREQGRRANEAQRQVSLTRPFYLGVKEVTNAAFRRFSKFHSSGHAKGNSLNNDQQPVVNITWQQAAAYCNWLSEQEKLPPFYREKDGVIVGFNARSNGYRLPLETEWAWAARYRNKEMLKYPWGQNLPPSAGAGNYADRSAASLAGNILVDYNDGYAVTAPVGSFTPNDKGLYDLGGNVAEWINDFYGIQTGLSLKTETDPLGPEEGDYHVIRGSSWAHGTVTDLRLSFRDYGTEARNDLGFRVARFVE